MLTVRLPENLEERLSQLAEQTHRSKSYYVKLAIQDFLDEQEEHLLTLSRLEKKNPRISLEEMEARLDVED
jgi:RHH-type rel operon transcriptional repressor/antitoxin RelB